MSSVTHDDVSTKNGMKKIVILGSLVLKALLPRLYAVVH